LGYPSWTREKRFATLSDRAKNMDQLDSLVEEWTKERSAEEVMTLLQGVGIAAGVVQDAADLWQGPQLKARGFFVELDHPVLGRTSSDGSPIKLLDTQAHFQQAAPLLGQHNDYVYRHLLGMSQEEIERYTKEGVLI
jgi:crotonobetainyl-CoA:carnitine CoA-transferase CaiB-like acyl-CoA transferase